MIELAKTDHNCVATLVVPWMLAIAILACHLGCSTWNPSATDSFVLPAPRPSANSVSIEITFVRIPEEDVALDQSIWAETDEQCVSSERRRHLNENGIRCGLLSGQLPEQLRNALNESDSSNPLLNLSAKTVRSQWPTDTPVPIIATMPREKIVALHKSIDQGTEQLQGRIYQEAQGVVVGVAQPAADGSMRLELTPEIHFGQARNQFIASEGAIQVKSKREQESFPDLRIDTSMAAGQTLLIGCTSEPKGIGKEMFTESENGRMRKTLLLRVGSVQRDELFESLGEL